MICSIINPSDSYTLKTDDFVLGGVATYCLSYGYGLEAYDKPNLRTPVMFGWSEWFAENGIEDIDAYVAANAVRIAEVLESVQLGGRVSREFFDDLRLCLTAEEHATVVQKWTDRYRTSLNDIGKSARSLALKLRTRAAELEAIA